MDLKEIAAILRNEKGKIIIVENGEPTMVILPYEEYRNTLEERLTATVNENGNAPEEVPPPNPKDADELTLDDLPL